MKLEVGSTIRTNIGSNTINSTLLYIEHFGVRLGGFIPVPVEGYGYGGWYGAYNYI